MERVQAENENNKPRLIWIETDRRPAPPSICRSGIDSETGPNPNQDSGSRNEGLGWRPHSHSLFQTFLVHGHLDGDVREPGIHGFVGSRRLGRVVLGILVELSNRAEDEGQIGDDLKGEELRKEIDRNELMHGCG